jgi:hypothetical protein
MGRTEEALQALGRAMEEGFAVEESLRAEADFTTLRAESRFRTLAGWPPQGELTRDERWRFDLDYLGRRMPQIHFQLDRKGIPLVPDLVGQRSQFGGRGGQPRQRFRPRVAVGFEASAKGLEVGQRLLQEGLAE